MLTPIRAFSPKPHAARILDTIIEPVVRATGFTGFLYAGLMMTPNGPSVLEFNVRLGDPETQPLMMRLKSDWGEVLMAAARGSLDAANRLDWSPEPATCVVMASGGYPGTFPNRPEDLRNRIGNWRRGLPGRHDSGGRTISSPQVGASSESPHRGADSKTSINAAYAAVDKIQFAGMHYRKDIGYRGLQRYNSVRSGP